MKLRIAKVLSLAALPTLLLAQGCSSAPSEDGASNESAIGIVRPSAIMKWRNTSGTNDGLRTVSAPAGAHLTYYGGRVVSNMQVVQVLWGSGSYLSQVSSTASPSMATFYQGVLNSPYVDWLDSDYNTVSPTGTKTNQHIGRGSFAGQYTITPASTSSSISDATIQTELGNQIAAGHLPAPTHDAAGNNNTYYAIFFPHGKTITMGGSNSCQAGGFCAYHGTISNAGGHGEIYYGVHPDMQAGSGCDSGCGNSTPFGNYTSVASHEMIETITDCEVGLATSNAPPLAWYDNTNGEIGDICNAQQGTVVGSDGVTYTVQTEFSNSQNNCIVSFGTTGPDFTISDSPSSLSIQTGTNGSFTVFTSAVGGNGTVSLAVSGAPAGVTVSLASSSIPAGNTTTATVAVSSTAAAGTYPITITGTEGTKTHTAVFNLTVTTGNPPPPGIVNGDFETGTLSGWTTAGTAANVSSGCHGGSHCLELGASTATNGDSTASQTFTAPTGATGISFWYKETCPDSVTYDWATVTLKDNTAGTTATLVSKVCQTNAWTQVNGAVTAGHSYTLTFTSHDDNYSTDPTLTLFDDVTLTSTTPPQGITNGGFEGSLAGWTTAGTAAELTSGCHSGTGCARLGNLTATNGDSSVSQTFTVPSGKTQLSFWYKLTCPDTLTYDWATATLKNNGTGTTTTVLAKTCTNNGTWIQVTAAVTAGTSYTLSLVSHDDNYTGDPTYTVYDDVTLN